MANTNNTNIPEFLTDKGDRALWTAARTSAKAANRHGVKVTAVLARLAASLVLSGSNLTELMSAVAQDVELAAHGVKADSLRAYRAPLRNLAKCLPAEVYATLTMSDEALNPVTARDWALGKNGAADDLMAAHNVDRAKLAVDMASLMATRAPNKREDNKREDNKREDNKREDNKREDNKREDNKREDRGATTYGEALETMVDAAQVLLNMTTRGELTEGERRMMMRNVAQIHAAFDAACAVVVGK